MTQTDPKPLFGNEEFVESERLLLRRPTLEDAPKLFALYTHDPEVTRFLSWKTNETVAETEAFLERVLELWSQGREFHFVVEKKATGQPIGMFAVMPKDGKVEFGYVLGKPEWGHGYTTEAASTMMSHLFKNTDVPMITIYCDVENKASEKVMQKAGLRFLKLMPKYNLHPNLSEEKRDCLLYGITREEFLRTGSY